MMSAARAIPSEPDITMLSSDDFWTRVSGIPDFRARLLRAMTILSWLVKRRSADEAERIKAEAIELFGDDEGNLDLELLAGRAPVEDEAAPL
jgi:hypothetical protein